MARTVSAILAPPTRTTYARTEIADDNRRGSGWTSILEGLNTLYEHYRGALVADCAPYDGSSTATALWGSNGETPTYRIPMQAVPPAEEAVDVYVYGRIATAGTSVTVQASTVYGGGNSWVHINSTTAQWWHVGTVDVIDGGDGYDEIELSIGAAPTGNIKVFSICVFYARRSTELQSVDAGDLTYPDGATPFDLAAAAGEWPLTATRTRQAHEMLRALYVRTWPIVASSYVAAPWGTGASLLVQCEVPPQFDAETLTARFHIHVRNTAASGVQTARVVVEGAEDVGATPLIPPTTGGWYAIDIDCTSALEGSARPNILTFRVITSPLAEVSALCGWWTGLTYGG